MKIVNFGSCNIDYVYTLNHIVRVGETEQSTGRDVFPGGKGLNQSIAVSKAGAKVFHAGLVGSDGEFLARIMEENGVDISYLGRVEAPNGHAVIQVSEKGENSIFIHTGSNGMLTHEYIDSVLDNFSSGDILIIQNETNAIDYIIDRAYEKGMVTFFNPSPLNENISKCDLNKISYVVLNEIEGEFLTHEHESEKMIPKLIKKYPGMKAVLTLGSHGCLYYDGIETFYCPAYDVEVVDSTAAGDTFLGYFVSSVALGKTSMQTLKIASAASAIAVSRKGAAPSIPTIDEVLSTIETLRSKESENVGEVEIIKNKIIEYIDSNLCSANLGELSKLLGYSLVYTGQVVRKSTGKSFVEYLGIRRCSYAAKLLSNSNMPVNEIIHLCGYSNETFFRDKFKSLYGMSPREYRKTMNKSEE